jgi:hypothetical protein
MLLHIMAQFTHRNRALLEQVNRQGNRQGKPAGKPLARSCEKPVRLLSVTARLSEINMPLKEPFVRKTECWQ